VCGGWLCRFVWWRRFAGVVVCIQRIRRGEIKRIVDVGDGDGDGVGVGVGVGVIHKVVANDCDGITRVRLTRKLISKRKWKGRRMIPVATMRVRTCMKREMERQFEWERWAGFETY
jgi:molybdenum cofactor biosynthesis enzyme MoaA